MKKQSGLSLIELLVLISIAGILFTVIFTLITAGNNSEVFALVNPRAAQAVATQRMADELAEQNRIQREHWEKQK